MEALVLFVFLFVSEQFGPGVSGGKTLAECEANRAKVVERVAEVAPQVGDRVYVGPCHRIEMKLAEGGKPA